MSESAATNTHLCAEAVTTALRRVGTAKTIARLTEKSPRTVERWLRGEGEPPASALVLLLARSRAFAQTILLATGLKTEWMDAEEARLEAELTALRALRGCHDKSPAPAGASDLETVVARGAETIAAGALRLSRKLR